MVSLSKGQKVSLEKAMTLCRVGLGWDPNKYYGNEDFDLDVSAFLLGAGGKVKRDVDFVFYKNKRHPSGAVTVSEDDTTGGKSDGGDDEYLIIDFTRVPSDIEKIVIAVSIYNGIKKKQNFGQVSNAYVRVLKVRNENDENGSEVVRFDLNEEFSTEQSVIACEIQRNGSEWKFNAIGAGYPFGLEGICAKFGVNVG